MNGGGGGSEQGGEEVRNRHTGLTCHVSCHEDGELLPPECGDDVVTVTLSHVAMEQPQLVPLTLEGGGHLL